MGGGPLETFLLSAVELGREAECEHVQKNERIYLWRTAAILIALWYHHVFFHQEIFYLGRQWATIVEFYQINFNRSEIFDALPPYLKANQPTQKAKEREFNKFVIING